MNRTPCKEPPKMRETTIRQAQIIAYIAAEVSAGRDVPTKRKIVLRFGKPAGSLKTLLTASFERTGLIPAEAKRP